MPRGRSLVILWGEGVNEKSEESVRSECARHKAHGQKVQKNRSLIAHCTVDRKQSSRVVRPVLASERSACLPFTEATTGVAITRPAPGELRSAGVPPKSSPLQHFFSKLQVALDYLCAAEMRLDRFMGLGLRRSHLRFHHSRDC